MDFSQELRLAYDKEGPFRGLVGVSHLHLKQWFDGVNVFSETQLGLNRATNSTGAPREVKTNGAFFGMTYDFNDRLTVSAEGRYQEDEVFLYNGPAGITISATNATALGVPGAGGFHAAYDLILSTKYKNFLPRAIVQYDFTDDIMGYVSYSKAVNVGIDFFNQTPFSAASATVLQAFTDLGLSVVVQPEKLTNYELGLKGKFFDNRMQGTLAIYRANWDNQVNRRTVIIQDAAPPAGTGAPQIVSGQANSGKVVAQGIEVDVLTKLGNFDLTVSAAMNDSDIRRFSDPSISQMTGLFGDDFKGHQLPLASKISANVSLQYNGAASYFDDGTWFARADANYKDKQYVDAGNLTWVKARTQVNLRAGLRVGNVGVDAYVQNAFNDKNYLSIAQNTLLVPGAAPQGTTTIAGGAFAYVNVALPELRTYGLKLTYKF
jgi:iron complex outermembrane recepter protein